MKIELSTLDVQVLSDAIVEEALKSLALRLEALEKVLLQRQIPPSPPKSSVPDVATTHSPVKPRREMLRRVDLEEITGLSPSTIYRLESRGLFPSRVQLSVKRVGWPLAAVERWVEDRQRA